MRSPTSRATVYAWHAQALADRAAGLSITVNPSPECGWFQRRLVPGGPYVAARIWLHQETDAATGELVADEVMRCEVDGRPRDPVDQWSWLCGQPITEAEFNYLVAKRQHAMLWNRQHPLATPGQRVDWLKAPPPTF